MTDRHQKPPYSLRIDQKLKEKARNEAHANHRSLNVEMGLLIQDGLKWREMQQGKQAAA